MIDKDIENWFSSFSNCSNSSYGTTAMLLVKNRVSVLTELNLDPGSNTYYKEVVNFTCSYVNQDI